MKKIHSRWLKGGLCSLLILAGVTSCSDDHFDLNSTNASKTLWENLAATGQANDFMEILEKVKVNKKVDKYKREYGVPVTLTYKDLLNSTRNFTVWAPKDGTYDKTKWLAMIEDGKDVDVETQFVKNHISNYNYNGSDPVSVRLMLLNEKFAVYDVPDNTFQGVSITSDARYKNMASTNGTLHLLDGNAPFLPNLREVLELYPELSDLSAYVIDQDTLVFNQYGSVAGSTVEGQIQYVDSAFYRENRVMPGIASNEDSLVAAIIPSNQAYHEALEKILPFYKYHEDGIYYYFDEQLNHWVPDSINADSLQNLYAHRQIFYNMYYSLNTQRNFDKTTANTQTVKTFFETADSLVSTQYYGYSYLYHQHAPWCQELSEHQEAQEASNGYYFITPHFNFKANKTWQFDIILDAENTWYFNSQKSKNLISTNKTGVYHAVTTGNRNDSIKGTVHGGAYQEFVALNGTSRPVIAFNIPNVLAGTYDIYVVIVPENMIDDSNLSPKTNKFTATIQHDYNSNGVPATEVTTSQTFISDPTKLDTILLFEDYHFPYSHYQLTNRSSFPTLMLNTVMTLADRRTVTPNFNIDCFILKGKDE